MGRDTSPAASKWQSTRKYARIPLTVRVEHRAEGRSITGRTVDIGLGGILILSSDTLEPRAEVDVRFKLPAGQDVKVQGRVAHSTPGVRMGICFLHLTQDDQGAISEYVEQIKPYKRRGGRILRRLLVAVRWQDYEGNWHEEAAETVLLSTHGGSALTPVRLKAGQNAYIGRPDTGREVEARIVFSRLSGVRGLSEIGFEFLTVENFWGIDFPPETPSWEMKAL